MDTIAINQVDPVIASYHDEWRRNRHIVEGARSVRANCENYIPIVTGQTRRDYQAYVKRIPFYPAASRTLEGLMGLIFRTPATITAPDAVKDILDTITAQGFTLDDLAEEVMSELLTVNYGALVTDYPVAPKGLTKAKAIDLGYRPFVALYKAESLLGVPETAVINNRQRVVRVRLLDDADTVRELRLDNGVYSITLHRNVQGSWKADAPIIPTKNGAPLDEIPFTLISTSRDFRPVKAPLGHVVELNIDHYLASADYATMRYYSTVRIFEVKGVSPEEAEKLPVYPGAVWVFEKADVVETKILSADSDSAINELKDAMLDIEDKMATVGSRMLAGEKAAVEAADTLRIRDNAQNATTASLSRIKDRLLNDQAAWVSWWLDLPEDSITYECNTNFAASPLTAQDITARVAMYQANIISLDTLHAMLMENDILPENYDSEVDQAKIAQAVADAPPVDVLPLAPNATAA